MGEEVTYYRPEFTEEEQKILAGEEPQREPEKPADSKEPEEQEPEKKPGTEQEQATSEPEKKPDAQETEEEQEEKKDPVQKRIDKLTWEKNEANRKIQLLKELGHQKYFEIYPDEAPAGYQPPQKAQPKPEPQHAPASMEQVGEMVVQVPGRYQGMTLNEVFEVDKAAGTILLNQYIAYENQVVQAERAKQTEAQQKQLAVREVTNFCSARAIELYDKDLSEATDEETAEVAKVLQGVIDWQKKTKQLNLTVEQAYYRMRNEEKRSKEQQAKQTLEKVQTPAVGSVGTKKVAGGELGYEALMTMSKDQLTDHIDSMPRAKFKEFMKDPNNPLRKKYPDMF